MSGALAVRITVRGRLSERSTGAFEGLAAVPCAHATELVGVVSDQAQLHGLLARIRDLGLELEAMNVTGAGAAGELRPPGA
jgi:hypothetical protein